MEVQENMNKRSTLYIKPALIQEARSLGINCSAVCRTAIGIAIENMKKSQNQVKEATV